MRPSGAKARPPPRSCSGGPPQARAPPSAPRARLSPAPARQTGFVFATPPAGVEYDGQVVKEGEGGGVFQQGQTRAQAGSMGGFNLNWDATWQVATSIDERGGYAAF